MYNSFINKEVIIIVSSRTENVLEYCGLLCEETENTVKLRNATINIAMLNFQKNIFGSNIGGYQQNIDEIIINKQYIISCSIK